MTELLKTKEADLTTADLASYGILDKAAAVSKPMPLFSE
jgi:hypothetical protein